MFDKTKEPLSQEEIDNKINELNDKEQSIKEKKTKIAYYFVLAWSIFIIALHSTLYIEAPEFFNLIIKTFTIPMSFLLSGNLVGTIIRIKKKKQDCLQGELSTLITGFSISSLIFLFVFFKVNLLFLMMILYSSMLLTVLGYKIVTWKLTKTNTEIYCTKRILAKSTKNDCLRIVKYINNEDVLKYRNKVLTLDRQFTKGEVEMMKDWFDEDENKKKIKRKKQTKEDEIELAYRKVYQI